MSFKRVDLRCKQLNADLVDGRDFLADSLWLSTVPYAAMPVYLRQWSDSDIQPVEPKLPVQ